MLVTHNLSLKFGERILFENVNIKFTKGNCYGVIGANGSGKSSFLKILYNELLPTHGYLSIKPDIRLSFLKQNRNMFNEYKVIDVVIMGDSKLYNLRKKINSLYSKSKFTESDGIKVANLISIYQDQQGWESESIAADILNNLGVENMYHNKLMKYLDDSIKVKVFLAQSIFKSPDILILDEPTNGLDLPSISWLEDFLYNYKNTVIVVSHDRHFLDTICTYICNLDYEKIELFRGNYSFWDEATKLANKQKLYSDKKIDDKKKELQSFIQRFSSNASKAKQATARKKILEKLNVNDIKPSSRKFPFIVFDSLRNVGDQVLRIDNLCKMINNDKYLFNNISFSVGKKDKIAIISLDDKVVINSFYNIITNYDKNYEGCFKWGVTVNFSYLPSSVDNFFIDDITVLDWLKNHCLNHEDRKEENIRNLLGKMLFSGDEVLKKINLLSGGERMRCMICKMMLNKGNVLVLDEPTKHLDIETITSLNKSLKKFSGPLLLSSYDHRLIETVCNRIIQITNKGIIDKYSNYNDFIEKNFKYKNSDIKNYNK